MPTIQITVLRRMSNPDLADDHLEPGASLSRGAMWGHVE